MLWPTRKANIELAAWVFIVDMEMIEEEKIASWTSLSVSDNNSESIVTRHHIYTSDYFRLCHYVLMRLDFISEGAIIHAYLLQKFSCCL